MTKRKAVRKAIQIVIPIRGDSREEEMAEEGDHDSLDGIVMEAISRLGSFLDETGYTHGSIFSGSKSVGIVDIDADWNVLPRKKGRTS